MIQEENMNKKNLKWVVLDNLPTIWVGLVFAFGIILVANHAGV